MTNGFVLVNVICVTGVGAQLPLVGLILIWPVTEWPLKRLAVTLPVIVATRTFPPVPVLAVSARFEIFLFFHVIFDVSFSDVPPFAKAGHELLLGSLSVAVSTPAPPVLDDGVQPVALPLAVAVCGFGVAEMPGLMLTTPVSFLQVCSGVAAPAGATLRPLVASAAAAMNS